MNAPSPLNIGFVGLGWGSHVAEMLVTGPAKDFFHLAGGCDADAAKVAEFCGRHAVSGYTTLEEMLEVETISVIGLFSGPAGRADLLRKIIHAGKDVMTTKPFELDPAAARTVLEEARALGRTIHVNSPSAVWPDYLRQIQRWQQEFSLGAPVSCRGEMLASYRETADGRWLDDPARCPAAPLFRLGIYPLNDLVRLFGPVSAVQVLTSRLFTGRPTPDNAQLGLQFANGVIGSVHASFCVDNGQHYANSLILNYERGTIWRNIAPAGYGRAEGSSRLKLVATHGSREIVTAEWSSPEISGSYDWKLFHDVVTHRRPVDFPVDEIVSAIEIIAAMARAEHSGRTEQVSAIA